MNKNPLIEEELKNEINQSILEKLTVNDEVLENSKIVEEYILKNIVEKNSSDFVNGGGKRILDFSLKLFNNSIKVNFCVTNFNFKNEQYFKEYNVRRNKR